MNTMSRSHARHRAITYEVEYTVMSIYQLHIGPRRFVVRSLRRHAFELPSNCFSAYSLANCAK